MEILAALTPKTFWRGDWRPGPRNLRFRFHTDPRVPGAGPLLKASEIGSPMTGGEPKLFGMMAVIFRIYTPLDRTSITRVLNLHNSS